MGAKLPKYLLIVLNFAVFVSIFRMFCLFGLRLYVPVNNFSVMSGRNISHVAMLHIYVTTFMLWYLHRAVGYSELRLEISDVEARDDNKRNALIRLHGIIGVAVLLRKHAYVIYCNI